MDPVDGFTAETVDDQVRLILSDRYGTYTEYTFGWRDAARLGLVLLAHALDATPAD